MYVSAVYVLGLHWWILGLKVVLSTGRIYFCCSTRKLLSRRTEITELIRVCRARSSDSGVGKWNMFLLPGSPA